MESDDFEVVAGPETSKNSGEIEAEDAHDIVREIMGKKPKKGIKVSERIRERPTTQTIETAEPKPLSAREKRKNMYRQGGNNLVNKTVDEDGNVAATCLSCGQVGHFIYNCPLRIKSMKKDVSKRGGRGGRDRREGGGKHFGKKNGNREKRFAQRKGGFKKH